MRERILFVGDKLVTAAEYVKHTPIVKAKVRGTL